jgi:hypothetical protein
LLSDANVAWIVEFKGWCARTRLLCDLNANALSGNGIECEKANVTNVA